MYIQKAIRHFLTGGCALLCKLVVPVTWQAEKGELEFKASLYKVIERLYLKNKLKLSSRAVVGGKIKVVEHM
jgi:hypothetical protein